MIPTSSCGLICMEPQGPGGDPCTLCAERWNAPTLPQTSVQTPKAAMLQEMEPTPPESPSEIDPPPCNSKDIPTELELTSTQSHSDIKPLPYFPEDIPTEILCRIFEHFVHADDSEGDLDWPDSAESNRGNSPFKLGNICTLWREIAWSTPSLWTLVIFSYYEDNLSHRIDQLEEILPRSGTLPLTLMLYGPSKFPPESFQTSNDFQRLNRCLYECSGRWYNLNIFIEEIAYIIPLFRLLPQAPNLKGLFMVGVPLFQFWGEPDLHIGDVGPAAGIDFATLAPNIEKLLLFDYRDVETLSIRWDNVINLTIVTRDPMMALQKAPHLRRLFLMIDSDAQRRQHPPPPPPPPGFTHANLHSLIMGGNVATALLNSVAVPNLEHLKLGSFHNLNGTSFAVALEHSRCGPTLTKLELCERGDTVQLREGILAVLGVLPSLTELDISFDQSRGRVEEYFEVVFRTIEGQERALLPNLQVFRLGAHFHQHDNFQFLAKVFEHVRRFSLPLRELSLEVYLAEPPIEEGHTSLDKELSRQIQAFRMEGRVVQVQVYPRFSTDVPIMVI